MEKTGSTERGLKGGEENKEDKTDMEEAREMEGGVGGQERRGTMRWKHEWSGLPAQDKMSKIEQNADEYLWQAGNGRPTAWRE